MTSKVKRITKFNRCIQFVISGHPTVATRVNKHVVSAGTQSDTLAEMEGHNNVLKFEPFGEPSTLGPRWTRWLSGFELFADEKGLIIEHLLGRSSTTPTHGKAAPTRPTVTFGRGRCTGHFPDVDGDGRSTRV